MLKEPQHRSHINSQIIKVDYIILIQVMGIAGMDDKIR